ncbi:hypothetical protein HMPREF9554_02333 [Treponema phagedenis F0421]|nr:hypothetical protein HMPREF9554_02333 [Treponema phagedenis F0421]
MQQICVKELLKEFLEVPLKYISVNRRCLPTYRNIWHKSFKN